MNVKSEKITIDLTGSEAWDIAYHIFNSLKQSVDTHYTSTHHDSYKRGYEGHAKPLLYEQAGKDIQIMNQLMAVANAESGGRLEHELIEYFKAEYIKKNGSLELTEDSK